MTLIASGIAPETERVIRKVFLVMDQVLVTTTPVLTGRARVNWIAAIGDDDVTEIDPSESGVEGSEARGSANAQLALSQARTLVDTWTLERGAISIVNNVSYIGELDSGSSAQAPTGMTKQALQAGLQAAVGERIRIVVT